MKERSNFCKYLGCIYAKYAHLEDINRCVENKNPIEVAECNYLTNDGKIDSENMTKIRASSHSGAELKRDLRLYKEPIQILVALIKANHIGAKKK